jgi:hypothetical protein
VGVKNSTSDLLMNSCDEFIFYDDLVRASSSTKSRQHRPAKKKTDAEPKPAAVTAPVTTTSKLKEADKDRDRLDEAIGVVVETAEALLADRGDRVWGSQVKQTLKRRQPGFNEAFYGFRSFSDLLEEAEDRGFLKLELDDRSGGYVILAVHRDE